eukprot:702906-Amphidinium_carterae.1
MAGLQQSRNLGFHLAENMRRRTFEGSLEPQYGVTRTTCPQKQSPLVDMMQPTHYKFKMQANGIEACAARWDTAPERVRSPCNALAIFLWMDRAHYGGLLFGRSKSSSSPCNLAERLHHQLLRSAAYSSLWPIPRDHKVKRKNLLPQVPFGSAVPAV